MIFPIKVYQEKDQFPQAPNRNNPQKRKMWKTCHTRNPMTQMLNTSKNEEYWAKVLEMQLEAKGDKSLPSKSDIEELQKAISSIND